MLSHSSCTHLCRLCLLVAGALCMYALRSLCFAVVQLLQVIDCVVCASTGAGVGGLFCWVTTSGIVTTSSITLASVHSNLNSDGGIYAGIIGYVNQANSLHVNDIAVVNNTIPEGIVFRT